MSYEDFVNGVRQARRQADLTQAQAAANSGVSLRTWAKFENFESVSRTSRKQIGAQFGIEESPRRSLLDEPLEAELLDLLERSGLSRDDRNVILRYVRAIAGESTPETGRKIV